MTKAKSDTVSPLTADAIRLEERMRFAAIMNSPEGQARPRLATKLATQMRMDVTVDEAIEMLADYPAENHFVEAMDKHGLNLGAYTPSSSIGASADPKTARLAELAETSARMNEANGWISPEQADARIAAAKHNPRALAKRIAR